MTIPDVVRMQRESLLTHLEKNPDLKAVAHAIAWLIRRDDDREKSIGRLEMRVVVLENRETYRAQSTEEIIRNVEIVSREASKTSGLIHTLNDEIRHSRRDLERTRAAASKLRLIVQGIGAAVVAIAFECWRIFHH